MGVPKLWDLIKDTAETRSLMHLAVVDGFEKNINGKRGYRIGIDASIWFFHAKNSREGENPELRLVFFRLAKLLAQPILPLFVFDGGRRPAWKRNKEISRKPHWMVQGVKDMILAFGFEWKQVRELGNKNSEAELAYLNQIGEIDAVLSDDVDNFLFGAKIVIRNPGRGLTGNLSNPALNSQGKDDGHHVRIFNADVLANDPNLRLTRAGFVLIGLMSGGDYEQDRLEGSAVDGCGVDTAHALAKCGFGDSLLDAFASLTPVKFQAFLDTWREDLRMELRTNSQGFLKTKKTALSTKIPDTFPNLDVLTAYASPVTSESTSNGRPAPDRWCREHSLARLATFCESKFEWGTKTQIQKRFASLLWGGALIRIIRRAALDLDNGVRESGRRLVLFETSQPETPKTPVKSGAKRDSGHRGDSTVETPSKVVAACLSELALTSPQRSRVVDHGTKGSDYFIRGITGSTADHPSTDYMLEYRVEINPAQLIALTLSGIRGDREDMEDDNLLSSTDASPSMNHKSPRRTAKGLRFWVPASMLELVEPDLVAIYKASQAQKAAKKKSGKKCGVRSKSSESASRTSAPFDSEDSLDGRLATMPNSKAAFHRNLSPILSDDDTGVKAASRSPSDVLDNPFDITSTNVPKPLVRRGPSSTSSVITRGIIASIAHITSSENQFKASSQARCPWDKFFSDDEPLSGSQTKSHLVTSPRKVSGSESRDAKPWDSGAISGNPKHAGPRAASRKCRVPKNSRNVIKQPHNNKDQRRLPVGLDPLSDSSASETHDPDVRADSPSPSHQMGRQDRIRLIPASAQIRSASTTSRQRVTVVEIIDISSNSDSEPRSLKPSSPSINQPVPPGSPGSRKGGPSRQTTLPPSWVRETANGTSSLVTRPEQRPSRAKATTSTSNGIIDLSSP
ncbi:uncharacterized protein EI90DRAFT_893605 [Cantharellus anzutake]|uniref:uncharacterized protein n=1 Tax=Cantharellus anzutake TaxID=1750568 RepID=UPI001907750E|nr:uncharacterized protein EI90DRAFT_893605 [Cantharellus anzutake]KAF8331862.1 hypothetical protein EI90DRAFT_893605 [Cantharellus anzutake]